MIMSMCKRICVTNRHLVCGDFSQQIEKILMLPVDRRPDALIVREKDLSLQDYQRVSVRILSLCKQYGVRCLFNGRYDSARRCGADGVQLSFSTYVDVPMDNLADISLVGVSVHSREEAEIVAKRGVDFLIYGHIFATACKPGLPPRGLASLRQICRTVHVPVFAIGGITEDNMADCAQAGATGVCMMSEYMRL